MRVTLSNGVSVGVDERMLAEWRDAERLCLFDALTGSGVGVEAAATAACVEVVFEYEISGEAVEARR